VDRIRHGSRGVAERYRHQGISGSRGKQQGIGAGNEVFVAIDGAGKDYLYQRRVVGDVRAGELVVKLQVGRSVREGQATG